MKKKFLSLIAVALTATMALSACGGSSTSTTPSTSGDSTATPVATDWEWENNIEIICPWGNGGGADTTLRNFAAALEKEIGVKVVVNNKAGAGGITGVQYFVEQPADGYTYLLSTPSPLLAQISGSTDYDVYSNIKPLVQLVHDCNVLVTGKNSPFNNYAEMMEYVAANPGTVKAGVMTITGLDGACIEAAFGDTIEAVAYSDGSQLNADIMGGHVSLGVVGPAEVASLVASGDVKVVMSFTEERLTMAGYENVECAGELGVESYFGPARGIFYKPGTPEAAILAFEAAAEKAANSETFLAWAASEGLDQRVGFKNTADFTAQWEEDYKDLTELFSK